MSATDTEAAETTDEAPEPDDDQDADLEPFEPDDDDDPDDDPEPLVADDEPSSTAAAAEWDAKLRKLNVSAGTWRRRVSDVLGDDALALVPCELCMADIPGFHLAHEFMIADDVTQARLIDVLRTPSAPEYVASPGQRQCDACKGWGKVRTGSKVPGQDVGTCGTCRGFGFVPPPGVNTATGEVTGSEHGQAAPPEDVGPQPDSDPWGSPRVLPDGQLNPNYGRMPQYKDANLP